MKTSAVLASLLFGSFAVAAPVDKRALVYHTEIVTETVVVYTTVYDDDYVPEATTTPEGLFYEQPKTTSSSSSSKAQVTSAAPAYTPAPVETPSSVYTPTPQAPESSAAPVYTPEPAPEPTPEPTPEPAPAPEPVTTEEPAPAPAPTTPAAEPAPAPSSPPTTEKPTTGESFSDVDITIYDNTGAYGACGKALYDSDMIVALAQDAWGASTYDVMTGEATNPWCGQKIQVEYQGNSIEATIMDLCPGCVGHDIDLSVAAWEALTGTKEKTRYKASWSKIA